MLSIAASLSSLSSSYTFCVKSSSLLEVLLAMSSSSSVTSPSKSVSRAFLNNVAAAFSLSFAREIPACLQQLSPFNLAIGP